MTTVNIPTDLRKALRSAQFFRNATYPSPIAQRRMMEETNHLLYVRTKCVASFAVPIASVFGATPLWRSMFHSSSHAGNLVVGFEVMPSGSDGVPEDPYVKLLVELSDGTDVGTAEFHTAFDSGSSATIHPPNRWSTGILNVVDANGDRVVLTPNTDYYLTFSDNNGSRLIAAYVYERGLPADTANGYLPDGPAAGSPIFDEDRGDMIAALRTAWKRNAAHLWNWSANGDSNAVTRMTASNAHWLDQTITTGAASMPSVKLMLANKSTVRRGTVPVAWKIYAKIDGGSACSVQLRDDSNNILDTITVSNTTAAWLSGSSSLALTANDTTQYALFFKGNTTNTITLYASSLYQYEA